MVTEASSNKIAITDLLQKHHPEIADAIVSNCAERDIKVIIIKGANDLWCRDFMPVQITTNKFVQFVYDPEYYHHKDYRHLQRGRSIRRIPGFINKLKPAHRIYKVQ